jgi:hypothetical protein
VIGRFCGIRKRPPISIQPMERCNFCRFNIALS